MQKQQRRKKPPKRALALPDLEQTLMTLGEPALACAIWQAAN
jgi:hypothetical protein